MSLYDDLGVPPDADADAIKKAHRKLARETHPNKTGEEGSEKFEKVQRAYMVLRDPDRRARYDATGETEQPLDNDLSVAAGLFIGAFHRGINKAMATMRAPETMDLIDYARRELQAEAAQTKQEKAATEKELREIAKLRKRIAFKGKGPDILGSHFSDSERQINLKITGLDAKLKGVARALDMVDDYECAVERGEPVSQVMPGWILGGTTA